MKIRIDPEFRALILPLTAEERTQLEHNVLKDGCRDPLVVWKTGAKEPLLLDGHNRYEICTQHGLPFAIHALALESRKDALTWIINNQLGRRNLSEEQASYLRGKRYNREKRQDGGHGDQKSAPHTEGPITAELLAAEYGVSRATIERDGQFANAIDALADTLGEEVKQRLLSHATLLSRAAIVTLAHFSADEQQVMIAWGKTEILAAAKAIKRQEAQERRAAREEQMATARAWDNSLEGAGYQLLEGDLNAVGADLAPDSIDAIITDPPYGAEHLALYPALWDLAARVLKPGGHCLVMVGQSMLPEILASFVEPERPELVYRWTLAYFTPGHSTQLLYGCKVKSNWKPVLWFTKGVNDWEHIEDVIRSEGMDKEFHAWGQSVDGMAQLIERFTVPGSLVLDPCCGGGATGVAAVRTKRLFVGIDIDRACVQQTAQRLEELSGETAHGDSPTNML